MIKRIAAFIAGHPKLIIIIAAALLVPSLFGYLATFINYDILSYLPEKLNSVQGERILDETFHNAASSFIVIENTSQKDCAALKAKIEQVEGVNSVIWVDSLADTSIPPEILPEALTSVFYSKDGSSTMMMVQYKQSGASDVTMKAINTIKGLLTKNCFVSGLSAINVETKELADREAPVYIAVAIGVALLIMMFTMQSFIQPFILLAALMLAVAYNMGSNIMFGSISYITQCIGAILQLGVTMDYSVFLMDRYDEELRYTPDDRQGAMARAIVGTFTSLAGSSLTTVFGFLALCFMSFTLGLDIGLVMVKGVLFGVLTVVTILPAFVLVFDKAIHRFSHKSLIPNFSGINTFLVKHHRAFSIAFLVLIIPAVFTSEQAKVYYDMSKAMPEDMPSVIALNKLKDEFDMSSTHFIIVDADLPVEKLTAMSDELNGVEGISNCISLNSYIGASIPASMIPDEIRQISEADGKQLIMLNSVCTVSTDECTEQIKTIRAIVNRYDPHAYITGESVLTDDLIEVTARDFRVTSIISIAAVAVLIAIFLKSGSLPFLLVASIELAIMINKGFAFLLGTEMAFISPTIIGCVQLGATVDYAILLSTRFREELHRGLDKKAALKKAADESDRSIFQSALVFFGATFAVYLTCDIEIIKGICALLARGAVISAIIIIFFQAPVLLTCESFINKTSYHWRKDAPDQTKGENSDETA